MLASLIGSTGCNCCFNVDSSLGYYVLMSGCFFSSGFEVYTLYLVGKSSTLAELNLFRRNFSAARCANLLFSIKICCALLKTFYCLIKLTERDLLFSSIKEVALTMVFRPTNALPCSDVRVLDARRMFGLRSLCISVLSNSVMHSVTKFDSQL